MRLLLVLSLVGSQASSPAQVQTNGHDSPKHEARSKKDLAAPTAVTEGRDAAALADSNSKRIGADPAKADSIKITDWIVALFTVVLGFVGVFQIILMVKQNSQ